MKHNIAKESLKKRLAYQFSFFVAIMMVLITVLVAFMLKTALTRNLEMSLSINANNSMKSIEQRVSFLAESTKNFSKNHFIINSLIDPQGRVLYLPKLVQDFSTAQDVYAVTVVDFEGDAVYSSLDNSPDYRETINLRSALISGTPIFHLSENLKNIQIVEPIEYYQTPQGAVIVEFNIESIASRTLTNEEVNFYKLFSKKGILYLQKIEESKKYMSIKKQAEKGSPYLAHMGIGLEMGVLKTKFLKPVRNAIIQLILIGFSFILVAVFIATKIGNSIAGPILQLCDRVIKAGVLEDEKCSPIGTGDELEELAQAFDNRTQQLIESKNNLEKQAIELKNFNEQLEQEIVERKQAQEALRESEERYRTVLESNPDPVVVYDIEGKVIYSNPAFTRVFGWTIEERIGKKMDEFVPEEAWEETNVMIDKVLAGESFSGVETRRFTKEGKIIPISISGSVYRERDNNPVGSIINLRDISEQKTLEKQLQQAQKMESIGTLAGGIAHDFNNILTTIIGNAALALVDVGKDGTLGEEIEDIKIAGERGASLTRQLLAFSRKQIIHPEVLDLNELLTDVEKMLGRLIGEDVELLMIQEPSLWQVEVDPGQIEQVIMNLAVNARDAMPMGGKLMVETANVDLDGDYFQEHGIEAHTGPYVMLSVSDTGSGMDKETQERIFEPFFTTKERGKGTGLGLSTVYGIVKQSKGFIWVYSEPGQGTTFKVYLPKAKGGAEPVEKEQLPIEDLGGSETVLLVEDDDSLRKLAHKILRQHGYRVLVAENGENALKVSQESDGSIDLLLTDVVMPKMSGKETAERLQPLYPHMKVIYMSGYTDNAIVLHGVLAPGLNFLEKPFSPEALVRTVRKVLDEKQD